MNASPIVIAAHYAPLYQGGLAAYQRCLAKALGEGRGEFLAEATSLPGFSADQSPLPWPLRPMTRTVVHRSRPLWPRLVARPQWHSALVALAERSWKLPRDLAPKVVHLVDTGWHFSGFAVARWARRCGAKFTVWPAVHAGQWGDDRIDLRLYQLADTVFCQSRFEADHLVNLGLEPEKVLLCGLPPMGLAEGNGTRLRAALGLGSRPVVFFLGRRDAGKGYPALLKAWQRVLKQVPEAVLLLAGSGGSEEAPGASLFPPDSWRNLGPITEQEKADAYAACTLFCLPSAHESFGIVFVEAASHGKPVICGTAPASRELVADGVTGLWANQEPQALAERIVHLLDHEAQARQMGEAGRALQQRRYSVEAMRETHLRAWGLREVPHP